MKILIVGSGGREHTLAWKIAQSPLVSELFCAPGNGGIAAHAECVSIQVEDIEALADFAEETGIDLTVIGPERPLVMGVVDHFKARGLTVYGPSAKAARLEGSKAFTNELLERAGVRGKKFAVFSDADAAKVYVRAEGAPIVVKADGDAAGKGVVVAHTVDEALDAIDRCMVAREFGPAGERVVIEECLVGAECSIKAFVDGETIVPMVPAQDYKRVHDGDTGPNTGGMGCYSPVPAVTPEVFEYVIEQVMRPTVRTMAAEGNPYSGTLYAGIILTDDGPRMLEYNCRFGDPETQVVLPRLESDLVEILLATAEGRLDEVDAQWTGDKAVCVVIASGGYPGGYEKGKLMSGMDEAAAAEATIVFHAGTRAVGDGLVTNGGRVLGVTGLGESFEQARDRAYTGVGLIDFESMFFRNDIAERAVGCD